MTSPFSITQKTAIFEEELQELFLHCTGRWHTPIKEYVDWYKLSLKQLYWAILFYSLSALTMFVGSNFIIQMSPLTMTLIQITALVFFFTGCGFLAGRASISVEKIRKEMTAFGRL